MGLDPQIQRYLESQAGLPPRSALSIAQTREAVRRNRALAGEPPALERVEDRRIPGPAGEIPIRVYLPESSGVLPVALYFHGGRFISGDLDSHDPVGRILAQEAGCMLVAVDYRLAPEHRFPAAAEDAYAAAVWLAEHARALGGDGARLAVSGDSAGGNLAAVVALMARDRGGPRLCSQVLIYPMLDATCSLDSHRECASGYGPTSADMQRGYREYLPEEAQGKNPYLSPLWAEDLAALAPALILTAEYDSLRDEAEAYAGRLREAGVRVGSTRYQGAIHGFFQMPGILELARRAIRQVGAFLRESFEEERACAKL